jgi:exosortase
MSGNANTTDLAVTPAVSGAAGGREWLLLGIPFAAALALYAPLLPGLAAEWTEFPSLSHGFAIPLIAAYLAWTRRNRLRETPIRPSAWGLPLLVLGLGALVVGTLGDESFVARISLPVILLGLTLFLAGWRVLAQVWLAIAYLALMVPLPYSTLKQITYRSRLFDAEVSAWALGVLGVPVHQDGVILHLPNIDLEVADACSSIPAIAALLSLGVAYAFVSGRPRAVQVLLVASTLPLAITANIIRITSVSWLAYQVGPWTLRTSYHMFNGTVNFMFTFLLLLALDATLGKVVARWRS